MVLEVTTVSSSGAGAVTLLPGRCVDGAALSSHGAGWNSFPGMGRPSGPRRMTMSVGRTGHGGAVGSRRTALLSSMHVFPLASSSMESYRSSYPPKAVG